TRTNSALPQTAPTMLPSPPITAAVSRPIDKVRVYAPGETIDDTMASSEPPTPAQAALTAKPSTCSLATFSPASEAATSSSRRAPQLRPTRLEARFASAISTISAAAQVSQASHRVGENAGPSTDGVVMVTPSPWSPPNTPAYLSATDTG